MHQCNASVCNGVSTPPQKHHLLFLTKPPLNLQTVHAAPLFRQPCLYIGFPPPEKSNVSVNPQNIFFPSLTPSYLLKVTKFLVKIPNFEFLVMTEKSIFVSKLFCHLIFPILVYFLCKNCTTPPAKCPSLNIW